MIDLLGYFGAFLMGIVLGLTGSGGSILTVPILVYLLHFNPVTATAYSLFIVGTTSTFGTVQNYLKDSVSIKTGIFFAIPSLAAIYLTRKFVIPSLPETIIQTETFTLTKDTFLMILFAVFMLLSSIFMIRKEKETKAIKINYPLIITQIFIMGGIIGLIGAGGGFLMIPVLVFIIKLPMKKAIGTSLFIISINSLVGFLGDIGHLDIDWKFLLVFTTISILGIFTGNFFNQYINESSLKKGFGYFVLIIAVGILTKELLF